MTLSDKINFSPKDLYNWKCREDIRHPNFARQDTLLQGTYKKLCDSPSIIKTHKFLRGMRALLYRGSPEFIYTHIYEPNFDMRVCSKLNFTSGLLGSILKRTWSWEIILRWRLFMLCFFSPLEVTCAIQDFCTQFCCMSKAAKTKEAKSDIFAINWRKNL